jgi:hypothetical protein
MIAANSHPPSSGTSAANEPGQAPRRLVANDIAGAFTFACDNGELDVAGRLLAVLENLLLHRAALPQAARRREHQALEALRNRLEILRQSDKNP